MLFELAHPFKFTGDFRDIGPVLEFSEHGCALKTANI